MKLLRINYTMNGIARYGEQTLFRRATWTEASAIILHVSVGGAIKALQYSGQCYSITTKHGITCCLRDLIIQTIQTLQSFFNSLYNVTV